MATRTLNLNLQLPGLGEFRDAWNNPINANFTTIDTWAGEKDLELQDARFTKTSLKEFLTVGINDDGTLRPTQEVIDAENSYLYGNRVNEVDLNNYYKIADLNLLRDKEIWGARAGQADLKSGIAFPRSFGVNKIFTGSKDIDGNPAWISKTGSKIGVDGSAVVVWLEINGRIARVRNKKEIDVATVISTTPGTYYLYAEYNGTGVVTYDHSTSHTAGCGLNIANDLNLHNDTGVNYTTEDVKAGDVITYPDTSAAFTGDFLIDIVAPSGETTPASKIQIKGIFPTAAASMAYFITDPLAVTLGVSATEVPTANRIYLAEFDYDGAAVTTTWPRNFGDSYTGPWLSIDTGTVPLFEKIWNHQLGSDKLQVTIQVSQANDGTAPIEELSLAKIKTPTLSTTKGGLGVDISDGKTVNSVLNGLVLSAGDQTLTAGSVVTTLDGTIAGAITGDPAVTISDIVSPNSVVMKYNKNQVWVKNPVSGIFYTDYDGITRTTGFIRVVISKKG